MTTVLPLKWVRLEHPCQTREIWETYEEARQRAIDKASGTWKRDRIMRKEDEPIRHKENGTARFRCP